MAQPTHAHLNSTSGSPGSKYHLSARAVRASPAFLSNSSSISCALSSPHQPRPLAEMAKKASSKKSLKSLFSKSEDSLDSTGDKDVDKTEGDKKKLKFFKIKTKSKSGSAPEKTATDEQRARRYVQDSRLQTLACFVRVAYRSFRLENEAPNFA